MTALRESTKKKIFEMLEKSYFTSSSFSLQFVEDSNPFLTIAFIPEKKFSYSISEPAGYNSNGYISDEAPGVHIETGERYKHENLSAALKAIGPWIERILEDYRSKNPVIDEFEAFRKALCEQINEHIHDKDSHFTENEAEALRTRLDELNEKLKQIWEKSEITAQKLKEAEQEIERIKNDIAIFPKGVWYQVAGSKLVSAVKKVMGSAEGRQFALETAKKFLLDGPK
ncbi:uncharacterized protein NMK_2244 [Novimethylophilus kurashikiensis]|uniref:Uncharacterized protein n=1 Tax=Novimethylophilus kurashikiensis TaxID=1825523 RepID=A0A2R5F9C9_9PROT|nr:hypothetical protein [Novimethylophilus kurashikiensis]GBG14645.1 uncharacterized protein NMK_2244 [Novimethylophilus kurashikiensis]